jgi:methylglutaconyl-CoA hydratase
MTSSFQFIRYAVEHSVARVTFCRPEIHNAFNSAVIAEMLAVFSRISETPDIRAVVLTGEGKSFCAGADLNWMRSVRTQSFDENLAEANALANLFWAIYTCRCPVIARVNGAAIGGGTGFVAVCDIAISAESAVFSFSEVKIGVVPACIGPYVIKKLGEGKARELFLTGERINARRAFDVGLVNSVVADTDLDSAVDKLIQQVLSSGPQAIATAKKLLSEVPGMTPEQFRPYTAEMIARLRQSDEGQEGMDAFLNKRMPRWVQE